MSYLKEADSGTHVNEGRRERALELAVSAADVNARNGRETDIFALAKKYETWLKNGD